MAQISYAKYVLAFPKGKKAAAQLTSSNSLVGTLYSLKIDPKKESVKILNKSGYVVADIDKEESKNIKL